MPSDFSVVALVSAYNEADIIEQVVTDLIEQGVQVYLIDDGSTDGTVAAVERHLGCGVLGVERLTNPAGNDVVPRFDWERILRRKTQLSTELEASWFIHHDADEFRESPWPHLSLRDAIEHVDALGFNAIDFTGLDFWPVHDQFRAGDDVRGTFTHYAELAPYDRVQVRCWKKTGGLDLASSGGHEARFPGRRVFPLRFILRHYPIRGQSHGERKVFQERRNRFREQERAQGWHVQYDQLQEGVSFLRDPSTLTAYDSDAVRLSLTLSPRYPEDIEEGLRAARSELAVTQAELAARQAGLAATQSEVTTARSLMNAMQGEIERASTHIEDVTAQLMQTRAELGARDEQLLVEIAARRTQSDAMHREIETASKHIDHVTTTLARTREELSARESEAAALRSSLEHRTKELADARAAASAELEARSAYIAALVEALNRRSSDVDELTRQRDGLQRSLSWRWTAPARAIFRLFKGS